MIPSYLSEDQATALEAVLARVQRGDAETVLVGPAGSGKSTLTKEIADLSGLPCVLGAPTGRAARVLQQKTGRPATTIHRLLYKGALYDQTSKKLVFTRPGPPCDPGDLLIIDEGSMVGSKLYRELTMQVPRGARILWIADREQLPPVQDTHGVRLERPDAALTQVHRQAEGSVIIQYATAVRLGNGRAWENSYRHDNADLAMYEDMESAIEWLVDARERNEDATLLTYTHKTRSQANQEVRERLGLSKNPISVGDRLAIRSNNHVLRLMNGETVTVRAILGISSGHKEMPKGTQYELELEELPGLSVFVFQEHIEAPGEVFQSWKQAVSQRGRKPDLYLHVHYGQCLTVHSAQGSQWNSVGFISDGAYRRLARERPEEGRRFLYTAITRAQTSLAVFTT